MYRRVYFTRRWQEWFRLLERYKECWLRGEETTMETPRCFKLIFKEKNDDTNVAKETD